MESKKYIVVTDAFRQRMISNHFFAIREPDVRRETYGYRKGHLGLIHTSIINFYDNLEENMKKHTAKTDKNGRILSYSLFPKLISEGDDALPFYNHEKNDMPILMHEKYYFLITLKNGEFREIEGTDLSAVKTGIKKIYEEIYNVNKIQEQTFDSLIEQWRHLEAFDILMEHKIHEIPMEAAYTEIKDETIIHEKRFLEALVNQVKPRIHP